MCPPVFERPRLQEFHRLVSVTEPFLPDDDMCPLLLLGGKQESRDVEIADTFAALALFDNDVHRRASLCDDRLVICA